MTSGPCCYPSCSSGILNWPPTEEITSALLVVDDQELAGEITARLLGFIVVTGDLDCRDADRDGQPGVELSGERPRRSRDGIALHYRRMSRSTR